MNSAVSIWFSFFDEFDITGCKDKICDFTPMNEVDIIWRYSGKVYIIFCNTLHFDLLHCITFHMLPCHRPVALHSCLSIVECSFVVIFYMDIKNNFIFRFTSHS